MPDQPPSGFENTRMERFRSLHPDGRTFMNTNASSPEKQPADALPPLPKQEVPTETTHQ